MITLLTATWQVLLGASLLPGQLPRPNPVVSPATGRNLGEGNAVTLSGQLTNLRPSHGTCYLALFASAEGFPRETGRAVRTLRLPVSGGNCPFQFVSLPPGSYALAVYDDENNNGRLDTNFLGIPTERYGFSNNARRMMFFPPSFEAARFVVPVSTIPLVLKLK